MKSNATPGLEDDLISIQEFQSRDSDEDEDFYMTLEADVFIASNEGVGQTIGLWFDDDNYITLEFIELNRVMLRSKKDGNLDYLGPLNTAPGQHIWKIQARWNSTFTIVRKATFYKDNVLVMTFVDQDVVPTIPLKAVINGGSQSASSELFKVNWITVTNALEYLGPEDQIEARGKRWSLIKSILTTHLQTELLVQEVIP